MSTQSPIRMKIDSDMSWERFLNLPSISQISSINLTPKNNLRISCKSTVKAFVVTPKMTKNSIILKGGYDKGYKNYL